MDPKTIQDIMNRLRMLEDEIKTPSHYHNGFDSNQISWANLYQKKLYIRHTVYGTDAAIPGNYGVFMIIPVACLVTRIQEVHEVAGTDVGAVTLNIEKLTSGVAPGAGSTLLSTAFSLKATINTVQTGTLVTTSSIRTMAAGDRIAMLKTGTLTLVGGVTVLVELQF